MYVLYYQLDGLHTEYIGNIINHKTHTDLASCLAYGIIKANTTVDYLDSDGHYLTTSIPRLLAEPMMIHSVD